MRERNLWTVESVVEHVRRKVCLWREKDSRKEEERQSVCQKEQVAQRG